MESLLSVAYLSFSFAPAIDISGPDKITYKNQSNKDLFQDKQSIYRTIPDTLLLELQKRPQRIEVDLF